MITKISAKYFVNFKDTKIINSTPESTKNCFARLSQNSVMCFYVINSPTFGEDLSTEFIPFFEESLLTVLTNIPICSISTTTL